MGRFFNWYHLCCKVSAGALMLLFCTLQTLGQKPLIDTAVYRKWTSISTLAISDNGAFVSYRVNNEPQPGQSTTYLVASFGNWRKTFVNVSYTSFSEDSKTAYCLMPHDSLAIIDLGGTAIHYIPNVISFNAVNGAAIGRWLICRLRQPQSVLAVFDLKTGKKLSITDVKDYLFQGDRLVVNRRINGEDGMLLEATDLSSNKHDTIWKGSDCFKLLFDYSGSHFAFMSRPGNAIWTWKPGMPEAVPLVTTIKKGYSITDASLNFNRDGSKLFFTVRDDSIAALSGPRPDGVNIWNYKDDQLQSVQKNGSIPANADVVVDVNNGKITYLTQPGENIIKSANRLPDNYVIMTAGPASDAAYYDRNKRQSMYLESTADGRRTLLASKANIKLYPSNPSLSPIEDYAVWFDNDSLAWFSYNIAADKTQNLSRLVPELLCDTLASRYIPWSTIGGYSKIYWSKDNRHIFLYSRFDIWRVDLSGQEPSVNITRGMGVKKHIGFGFIPGNIDSRYIDENKSILLSGFNIDTKANGFWTLNSSFQFAPEKQIMDDHNYVIGERTGRTGFVESVDETVTKAKNANVYIVGRMSASESPNFFVSTDFRTFKPVSNVHPEQDYNWLTTELVTWKMLDGRYSQGILYKPENFDRNKKYPLIFTYYEKRSDELNNYFAPEYANSRIDIPTYVSNGYLVFVPDVYGHPGHNGDAIMNAVVSAAHYLSKRAYVDSTRLGLQGHSFGGWETNYLVTHTHIFAAACEAAGQTDQVSAYGGLMYGIGYSRQNGEIRAQGSAYGLGITPWTRPDLYIVNSPVFKIDDVTTPLLMMHNEKDSAVPFDQAIEFFTGLKRAGKKVWLLQYDNGDHFVQGKDMELDYTIRMQQFFDHYLKDALPPKWMTQGVPYYKKGIDNGYELDNSGTKP